MAKPPYRILSLVTPGQIWLHSTLFHVFTEALRSVLTFDARTLRRVPVPGDLRLANERVSIYLCVMLTAIVGCWLLLLLQHFINTDSQTLSAAEVALFVFH